MQISEAEQRLDRCLSIDPPYQQLLAECLEAEQVYLSIQNQLSPTDAEALDRYITLCEELDHRKLTLALTLSL